MYQQFLNLSIPPSFLLLNKLIINFKYYANTNIFNALTWGFPLPPSPPAYRRAGAWERDRMRAIQSYVLI
jgi:hypothetical protein